MRRAIVSVVFLSFVILPVLAVGQQAGCDPDKAGCHTHDGFFLRLSTGVGYHITQATMGKDRFSIVGLGSIMDFAIGGMVAKNLAVHLDLFGSSPLAPGASQDWDAFFHEEPEVATSGGMGIGATWYAMPYNVYLSLSFGLGVFGADEKKGVVSMKAEATQLDAVVAQQYYADRNRSTSLIGVGANFMVGKEWWVSHNWGLGVAASAYFVRIPSGEPPDNAETMFYLGNLDSAETAKSGEAAINSLGFGLVFSASFN